MLCSVGRALPRLLPRARHRPARVHPPMPRLLQSSQPAQRHRRAHDAASHAAAQPAAAAAITMARAAEPMSAVMWADDCRAGLCRSCPLWPARGGPKRCCLLCTVPYVVCTYRTLSVYERITSVPSTGFTRIYRYSTIHCMDRDPEIEIPTKAPLEPSYTLTPRQALRR